MARKSANDARSSRAGGTDFRANRRRALRDFEDEVSGEDAFQVNQDSILLDEPSVDHSESIFDDQEEVLSLKLPSSAANESNDVVQSARLAKPKKKPSKTDHDPVLQSKTSRFQRPEPVDQQESDSETDPTRKDDDLDNRSWGGNYHLTRREMNGDKKGKRSQKKLTKNQQAFQDEFGESEAVELREALRIQKAQRSLLQPEDFGTLSDLGSEGEDENGADTEEAPIAEFSSREEAIAHLLGTQPHLLSLLTDFRTFAENLSTLRDGLQKTIQIKIAANEITHPIIGLETLYVEQVEQYLIITALYLKMALQGNASSPLGEKVFAKLVEFREGIQNLQDAGIGGDEEDPEDIATDERSHINFGNGFLQPESVGDDEDEVDDEEFDPDLLDLETGFMEVDSEADEEEEDLAAVVPTRKRKRGQDAKITHPSTNGEGKRKRRRSKKGKSAAEAKDVIEKPYTKTKALLQLNPQITDDFVESADTVEKEGNRKKRDLAFHTSQIAATANRRAKAVAGRQRDGGGDDDVPYVSKEQMRREVQRNESARAAKAVAASRESEDLDVDMTTGEAEPEDDGYYDLIKQSKAIQKAKKKQDYDGGRLQDRATLSEVSEKDGPRSVTRAILANKGLTPKRAKANRNPRVKKRLNYEKAKKKVSSMKSIYKPSEAAMNRTTSGYQGEKSGIGSKVVKSRKLSG